MTAFGFLKDLWTGKGVAGYLGRFTGLIPLVKLAISIIVAGFQALGMAHILYRLWVTGLKLWMLVWVYTYVLDLLMYYVKPFVEGVVSLVPRNFMEPVFQGFWQFVNASSSWLPWDDIAVIAKWLILVKLFLLVFHLTMFITAKSLKLIEFVMGS